MARKPVVSNAPGPPLVPPTASLLVGQVVGVSPAESRMSVRLTGLGGRAMRNVIMAEGVDFQTDDRVLLAHTPNEEAWIAVTKVRDTLEYGLAASKTLGGDLIVPPSGFTVTPHPDIIVVQWAGWAGACLCFEVQHNSTQSATSATSWYTRGSHYVYQVSGDVETRYFRVRAVRYNPDDGYAYYSGFTAWAYATSRNYLALIGELYDYFDETMSMHLLGIL